MAANAHKRMGLKEMSIPIPLNLVISSVADEQKSSPSFNWPRLIFNNEKVDLLLQCLPLQFVYILVVYIHTEQQPVRYLIYLTSPDRATRPPL